jgi:transcriptional regulator with XRE-family HTH domain
MYGAKLRAIRQLRDYTQEFVATKAGIKQNVYCQIEKDEIVKIQHSTLEKIADALGVTVEDIKNPMPVVVNLNQKENANQEPDDKKITARVIDELAHQLHVKDEQIGKLLQIIDPKNSSEK